jgi:hypothetical protein
MALRSKRKTRDIIYPHIFSDVSETEVYGVQRLERERKRSWPTLQRYLRHLLRLTEEPHDKPQCSGRDSNWVPPESEPETASLESARSIREAANRRRQDPNWGLPQNNY